MSGQHEEPGPAPELTVLEEQLRRLSPREAGIDRDTLLFRAGRASAPRGWLWPAVAAVSSLTALALGATLALQPPPQVVERIIYVPVDQLPSTPVESITAVEETGVTDAPTGHELPHHRLQEHLLRWGLDGLGQPPAPGPVPRRPADLFSHYSQLSRGEIVP